MFRIKGTNKQKNVRNKQKLINNNETFNDKNVFEKSLQSFVYPVNCLSFIQMYVRHLFCPVKAIGEPFADSIDQDQTAQNVQSDLDLCRPVYLVTASR